MRKIKNNSVFAFVLFVFTFVTSCGTENLPNGSSAGTVKDIDGNTYHTVKIGNQVWMVENLKTTKYNDGSTIPIVTDNTAWHNLTTGACCSYNNNATIGAKYGKLYNWYAVNTGKLAPSGWHVPTDVEWTTLVNHVSANLATSGYIAKELATTTDWVSSTIAGAIGNNLINNNNSGFSALPGGYGYGLFNYLGERGYWWSTTEYIESAWSRFIYTDGSDVIQATNDKQDGLSVRCVKD